MREPNIGKHFALPVVGVRSKASFGVDKRVDGQTKDCQNGQIKIVLGTFFLVTSTGRGDQAGLRVGDTFQMAVAAAVGSEAVAAAASAKVDSVQGVPLAPLPPPGSFSPPPFPHSGSSRIEDRAGPGNVAARAVSIVRCTCEVWHLSVTTFMER